MTNDEYYAELRAVAQTLRVAAHEAERRLTAEVRDESPEWLLERLDAAVRAANTAAGEVGRFIREDRTGPLPAPFNYGGEE